MKPMNVLKPAGDSIRIPLSRIKTLVMPRRTTLVEEETGKILIELWRRLTGNQLHVTFEHLDSGDVPAIYFGATERAAALPAPGPDGIAIGCDGKNLVLAGGSGRGLINAVITLLTEDFGCRFYTPEFSLIPRLRRATVTPRTYTPPLEMRDPFIFPAFDWRWSLLNRTNSSDAVVPQEFGGHVRFPGSGGHIWHNESYFCHTYHMLVPPERYFDAHPEYYQLASYGDHRADGHMQAHPDRTRRTPEGIRIAHQLCETNPEVHRIAAAKALEVLRSRPDCRLFDVSKVDGGGTCQCARCRGLNEAEGSDSASMLTLVNAVADAVAAEFPEVKVTTAAYLETIRPPATIRPRPNVLIRLCNDQCAWPHPFTPVRQFAPMVEIVNSWKAIGAKFFIWDYSGNFNHYAAPMPNLDVVADNIRFWIESGAYGVMIQGAYQCDGSERDYLRCWVEAQLLWNPSLDLRALVEDFVTGYYGVAAPEMLKYENLLEATGREHRHEIDEGPMGIRYSVDCPMLNDQWVEAALKLHRRALRKARNDQALRRRIERNLLSVLYVKISNSVQHGEKVASGLLEEFERIAQEIQFLYPGETTEPGLDALLRRWKEGNRSSVVRIKPAGGKFPGPVKVRVTPASPTVWLTYTLDGSEPTYRSERVVPDEDIQVTRSTTLKIAAMMLGSCVGGVVGNYEFQIGK